MFENHYFKPLVKNPPTNVGDTETQIQSMDQEDSPGEGNGNPLQYSCLENPMDGGAWQATVDGAAKSWAWLSTQTLLSPARQLHFPLPHIHFSSFPGRWAWWYDLILTNELKNGIFWGHLGRIFILSIKEQYKEGALWHFLCCFLLWVFFYEDVMLGAVAAIFQYTNDSLKLLEKKRQRRLKP